MNTKHAVFSVTPNNACTRPYTPLSLKGKGHFNLGHKNADLLWYERQDVLSIPTIMVTVHGTSQATVSTVGVGTTLTTAAPPPNSLCNNFSLLCSTSQRKCIKNTFVASYFFLYGWPTSVRLSMPISNIMNMFLTPMPMAEHTN